MCSCLDTAKRILTPKKWEKLIPCHNEAIGVHFVSRRASSHVAQLDGVTGQSSDTGAAKHKETGT